MQKDTEERGTHFSMTLRVKPQIGNLLETMADQMAMTKTALIVYALRELAKREGISVPREETSAR